MAEHSYEGNPPAEWEKPSEEHRVRDWRLHVLLDTGYPYPLAEKIAERLDVDLHEAVRLIANGCAHDTAAEILL